MIKELRNKIGSYKLNLTRKRILYQEIDVQKPKRYKIVGVTPAGRKKYLEILIPYLLQNRNIIDTHIFWINTTNQEDIEYIKSICERFPSFFKYEISKVPINGNKSIAHFFLDCQDENTIYIRFDDDICFIDKNAIFNLVNFRLNNPKYFLVFGNIINNAICNYINQQTNSLPKEVGNLTYDCYCKESWINPKIAINVHRKFLEDVRIGSIESYKFDKWVLKDYEGFSINFMSWFGKEFKMFNGEVGGFVKKLNKELEEEPWLTGYKPKQIKKLNCICGDSIVSHFAFYTQRDTIESTTNLLEQYKKLSETLTTNF